MKLLKILVGVLFLLVVLAGVSIFLFADSIFSSALNSALADLPESQGIAVSFEEASLGFSGKANLSDVRVVDVADGSEIARIPTAAVEFSWSGLFATPVVIDRLSLQNPVVTLSPGLQERFAAREDREADSADLVASGSAPEGETETTPVQITQAEIVQGLLLYKGDNLTATREVALLDFTASNISGSEPFDFNIQVEARGGNTGQLGMKGRLDPVTYDCDIDLDVSRFKVPELVPGLPETSGQAKFNLKDRFSQIATHGDLRMPQAPEAIPAELRTTDPFEVSWNLQSDIAPDSGRIELKTLELSVRGLQGGPRRLTGSGSLDPNTYVGGFTVEGQDFEAALLNPFLGSEGTVQIRKGTVGVAAKVDFSGIENPVRIGAQLKGSGLALETGDGNVLTFLAVNVGLVATYEKPLDRLAIQELSLKVDDIPLTLSGTIDSLLADPARQVDLRVNGQKLDLARLIVLVSPAFSQQGTLGGTADVDLSITGQTASEGFPRLEGSVNLQAVTFVPADNKDLRVAATGKVAYSPEVIATQDLKVELAGVPGTLTASVRDYNQPVKQVEASVKGVSLEPVLNLVNPEAAGYLTGVADADIRTSLGPDFLPQNLTVQFTISKGTLLKKNPLPASVAETLGWKWLKGNYPLTKVTGSVSQEGAGYRLTDVSLIGAEGGVRVEGLVTPGKEADLSLAAIPAGKTLQGKGEARVKVDLNTLGSQVSLNLEGFSYPTLPATSGSAQATVSGDFSSIQSKGSLRMAEAPAAIPPDIREKGPFSLDWNVDAVSKGQGSGPTEVRNLELTIGGLQGGQQRISGSGSYDPASGKGSFKAKTAGLSLPLLNPYVEPALEKRILSGKADLDVSLSREGEKSPFIAAGTLNLVSPALRGVKDGDTLKFNSVGLKFDSTYSPAADSLELRQTQLQVDQVPLDISGKVTGLQNEKTREVALAIRGQNIDTAQVIDLAAPDFSKEGMVRGRVNVDLKVTGKTASPGFPTLNGTAETPVIEYIPKNAPQQNIKARGKVEFDGEVLKADNLDIKLAEQPAKLTLKVTGYNAPVKRIDAHLAGAAIEPLLQVYKPSAVGIIQGNLTAEIMAILGQKERPDALEINFTIANGVMLTRHPIPNAIVNLVNWEWMRNGFALNNAKGLIVQEAGGYNIQNLFLMGAKGGFTARGLVGFDNRLDLEVRLNIAKQAAGELPSTVQKALRSNEGSDWAYLGFDVGGTVERPLPKPQFENLLGAGVDRLSEEIREKYGDEIKEKTGVDTDQLIEGAGGVLRGFIGGDRQ